MVRNFTNAQRQHMFRRCLLGCGGAILNDLNVKRALLSHCRAYRNTLDLKYVFQVELRRGWEIACFSPNPGGEPPPGYSAPGEPKSGGFSYEP